MRFGKKMCVCAGVLLLAGTSLSAVTGDSQGNPYAGIKSRNAFDLKPLPPEEPKTPEAPPINVELTGLMTVFGKKKALFLVQEGGGKPPVSYVLSEGEKSGELEVLEVNQQAGSAKIKKSGTVSVVELKKQPMLAAVPAPAPAPPPAPAVIQIQPKTRQQAQAAQNAAAIEQQEVLIELNRQRYLDSGNPTAKVLPPTSLTVLRNEGE